MISIGDWVFSGCSGLTSITIPESVTSIGNGAFCGCSELTSITIPESVTSIGGSAFRDCSGVTFMNIPKSVTSIFHYAFYGCASLTSINIPNSVTSIDNSAFAYCSNLKSITIPESVATIREAAFANCPELTDIYCYRKGVPNTQSDAFDGSYIEYVTLHVPASAIDSYKATIPWSNFKEIEPLPGITYKLRYLVDNTLYMEYEVEFGASITAEPAPTKEGYTFSGWSGLPATMPAKDVIVTGSFTANKYKLTYTVDGEVYKSYDVEYGASITAEAEPTKEGYTFSGWSYIPSKMPAEDVTVVGTFIQTAIDDIHSVEASAHIYDLNGYRIGKAKPGVNIIRQADGKTRKVILK